MKVGMKVRWPRVIAEHLVGSKSGCRNRIDVRDLGTEYWSDRDIL